MTTRRIPAKPRRAARKIVNRPEEALQRTCVRYLAVAMPPPPEGAVYLHVPNQRGTRSKIENAILKALGVLPGVPDLLFLFQGRLLCAELKAPNGSGRSEAQIATQEQLRLAGAIVLEDCRSVDHLACWLRSCGVPLRVMPALMPYPVAPAVDGEKSRE